MCTSRCCTPAHKHKPCIPLTHSCRITGNTVSSLQRKVDPYPITSIISGRTSLGPAAKHSHPQLSPNIKKMLRKPTLYTLYQ